MNDDQILLANAYVDGELTDDERRIAEADPAVMAEVDVLRELHAELRAVDAPTEAARESAIGAAMAQFTPRGAAASPAATASASVVPFRPKPAYSRYLGVAAAVVAVGLLGVVIVNGGRGGDNDASVAEPAALDQADAADDGDAQMSADRDVIEGVDATLSATAAVAEDSADAAGAETAEAEMAADDMADDMAEDVAGDEAASEPFDDAGTLGGLDAAYDTTSNRVIVDRPDIDVEESITNDAELGAYGTYLLEQQIDSVLPPTPNTECDAFYNILDDAVAIINNVETDVYIAVQEAEQRVVAVDRDSCLGLVDGPLFPPTNR